MKPSSQALGGIDALSDLPLSAYPNLAPRRADAHRRGAAWGLDRIMTFFSDDCILEMLRGSRPWGSRFEGKRNVREALAMRFEGLPDVHYGNDEHFVDAAADTGISKWTLTGTAHEGTRKEVQGCDFYTFRNGKMIRKDVLENHGLRVRFWHLTEMARCLSHVRDPLKSGHR